MHTDVIQVLDELLWVYARLLLNPNCAILSEKDFGEFNAELGREPIEIPKL